MSFYQKLNRVEGDAVRSTVHKKFGFSRADIRENDMDIARMVLQLKSMTQH